MLADHHAAEIGRLLGLGWSINRIARETGHSRVTVRRIARGLTRPREPIQGELPLGHCPRCRKQGYLTPAGVCVACLAGEGPWEPPPISDDAPTDRSDDLRLRLRPEHLRRYLPLWIRRLAADPSLQ